MASNLSTIGFVFPDQETFQASMLRCAEGASVRLPCPVGEYGIWQSRTGAQVWFHLARAPTGEVEILGLTPFFEGKSEIDAAVTRAIHREGDNAFEGAFHAWVKPDDSGAGAYPLVFDAVDYSGRTSSPLPLRCRLRLAAFARELRAFNDAEDFLTVAKDPEGLSLAAQAFVPTGLFVAEGNATELRESAAPSSSAFFTGLVREHSLLRNETTGLDFHWLLAETLDNVVLDVVADTSVVKGEIVEGGTIEATAALFGRLLA